MVTNGTTHEKCLAPIAATQILNCLQIRENRACIFAYKAQKHVLQTVIFNLCGKFILPYYFQKVNKKISKTISGFGRDSQFLQYLRRAANE